ncbi:hypothetical protein LSCM1_02632 [Leishmania martiniquensis]|uniref:Uncharacterized protein n=1 Tax=Leishmania martiniquensis TaxID=1580590 RepID=A0A836GT18_9TRYP|nr:hypothetical protein LSCM1_02632 [Leishmania martiniquensis]
MWETMADTEARARVQRLRQSAASLQDVYGAFAPWQHLPTSVRELDSLLGAADVSGGVSDDGGRRGVEPCIGGLPVGGLHELYGPPLSGKSWILRRIGAAYVRRMTAYRQWYHDELVRVSAWGMEAMQPTHTDDAHATKGKEDVASKEDVAGISADLASASPMTAVGEWDLYVCMVSGAGAGGTTDRLTASSASPPPFSPDVRSWLEELVAPFGSSLALAEQEEASFAGPVHQYSSLHQRRQQQRAYAEQHIHFCVVHSPNELLAFLERLSGDAASARCTGTVSANSAPFIGVPAPLVASQQQTPSPQLPCGSLTTSVRGQKRRRTPATAVTSSPAFPLSRGNFSRRTWRLQRQRLLLLDGLDALWLHPTLGNHSATHAGQWFAEELHRQLRAVLSPKLCCSASTRAFPTTSPTTAAAPPAPHHSQLTLYSTVICTNGCNGGNGGSSAALQLETRLVGPPGGVAGWMVTVPRPSGNAVWVKAADTRCLVEPAHVGLVSMPTPGSSYGSPAHMPRGVGAMRHSGGRIAGSFGQPTGKSLESLVTVVKGGSRVAATWVLRDVPDG